MSLRLTEEQLQDAIVQLATLSAAFLRYVDAQLTFSQARDKLAQESVLSWDETGDVIERLEEINRKRLKR